MPDNPEIRSEEVQEVLSFVPSWMIRWGNTLIFLIIIGILLMSWYIKYPTTAEASMTIVSDLPFEEVVANTTGILEKAFVQNGDSVIPGTHLGIIQNDARYEDMLLLQQTIMSLNLHSKNHYSVLKQLPILFLGDVGPRYNFFKNSYKDYLSYLKNLDDTEQIDTSHSTYKTLDFALNQLKKAIKKWEFNYVLKSSINGKVQTLLESDRMRKVVSGDSVFNIKPFIKGHLTGKLNLQAHRVNSVAIGQKVNIKLFNYPNMEYGHLEGSIENIASNPDLNGTYPVSVSLPQKPITTYKKEIAIQHNMQGSAEIIIEDLRLLERLFLRIRQAFDS